MWYRILIVDWIKYIYFNLLIEIDDTIVNHVYLTSNVSLNVVVIAFQTAHYNKNL